MKSRKYLNVGAQHVGKEGEFFDANNLDWYVEVEQGQEIVPSLVILDTATVDKVVRFPVEHHNDKQ